LRTTIFWEVTLNSFVEICWKFRETCLPHLQSRPMSAVASSSKMSENFHQTTWCYILE